MRIVSTNAGRLEPTEHSRAGVTGHRKVPLPEIHVADVPPDSGTSGITGDEIGDTAHHGGRDQAVYVFAREHLDRWAAEIGAPLPDGSFAENLTTEGFDPNDAVVGERWAVGTAELVVTHPRTPCRTFAGILDQPRWVRRFTDEGRPGPYLRVTTPGLIRPGDEVVVLHRPDHGVTIAQLFAAFTRDRAIIEHCLTAGDDLTDYARDKLVSRRTGAVI